LPGIYISGFFQQKLKALNIIILAFQKEAKTKKNSASFISPLGFRFFARLSLMMQHV